MNALADALVRGVDPVALAADLGLHLDDWQAELLRSDEDALVNGSRQVGKSTACALKVLHKAIYSPRSLSLLLAPSLRQSVELFHGTVELYRRLGRPVDAEAENTIGLALENGSRILALPGSSEHTIRGYGSVSLLVVDEAARVEDGVYHAVAPMLAVSRGARIAISTPNGRRGWWWSAWSSSSPWKRYTVRASECDRISPEFLAEARREMPDWLFAQEFEAEFTDSDVQAFRGADIEAAFDQGMRQ